ncbi:MAG: pyridoxal-phosphate dependent enzyme [Spirochaetales bacterium]|jgi:threonine synthase|nr:pyridoxal-phosphate dependent enzyme [Spirochaetales bacterium]
MNFSYRCSDCGRIFKTEKLMYRCPSCEVESSKGEFQKGNLIVDLNRKILQEAGEKEHITAFDLFPYEIPVPAAYPVGNTPLAEPGILKERYGLPHLSFKLDGQNPSGSFKDRASQLVAAQATALGENKVVLASTGNAGSAMACAGAAYGLEIILFVPASAPVNKLMQSVLYGAHVIPVNGTYDDAFALSIAYTQEFGGINRNTAYNPMTVEGKKSVSIELFEQLGRKAPDAVYIPVGDGVIYSGVFKGFSDLKEAGLIGRIPALICVQSTGSDAISKAWKTNSFRALTETTTFADSISVCSPANGRMAVDYIRKSQGWAVAVDDAEISAAQLELARDAGIFAEPAAAAAWAGIRSDIDAVRAEFGSDAHIVTLITGSGFKDMNAFEGKVSIPRAIEPTIEAMRTYIASKS